MTNPVVESSPSFSPERLRRISELEQWHFWFVGRRSLLIRLLSEYLPEKSSYVLDLGCGTGHTMALLENQGYRVAGMEMLAEGLKLAQGQAPAASLVQADALRLPLAQHSFDAVLLLDVLEHVDDQALLSEVHRVTRPGGLLFVTVPALSCLWSYRDVAAGHLRRYSLTGLQELLISGRFHVYHITYFQFFLLPLLMVTRLLGRRGPRLRDYEESPGLLINKWLARLAILEVQSERWFRWPLGSSLVAVCRRQGS